jgi:glycosyltransferase involved in cell wall biosynthesis
MGMSSIIVSRAHRYDVYEGGTDMVTFWPKRDFLLKNIEKVFPISDNAKLYLDERFNSKDKTIVSKLGVFDNHAISKSSNSGMFHIVSVSRLDKVKRVGFILKSLENLSNKLHETEIKWTHFGGGSLYNELKSESARITVKNLKIEFKGIVDNSKIYEFYRESSVDCFINLSSSEGIPVSIMEAQSFGIPTVATDVGGTSEIVTEENGILLKSNPTIEEVTDALTKIYYNKPDRKLIKENWNKNFNAERNYVQFAKDLLKLSESLHYGM